MTIQVVLLWTDIAGTREDWMEEETSHTFFYVREEAQPAQAMVLSRSVKDSNGDKILWYRNFSANTRLILIE